MRLLNRKSTQENNLYANSMKIIFLYFKFELNGLTVTYLLILKVVRNKSCRF